MRVSNRLYLAVMVIVTTVLFMLTACDPDYPKCENDEHCSKDRSKKGYSEFCVQGMCQQCRDTSDCPEGYQCLGGACEKIEGYCSNNIPCPPPKVCKNNRCEWACVADSDCAPGEKCKNHQCEMVSVCFKDADCPDGYRCETETGDCVPITTPPLCKLDIIYFDYDESYIRTDQKNTLDSNANCLSDRTGGVTIEGHCDERGTIEYNLALGERRANEAKKYLKKKGVDGGRMDTVSYGESRPAVRGSNESAWAKNRRCEFIWE